MSQPNTPGKPERRAQFRYEIRVPVLIRTEHGLGHGVVREMSGAGASVEEATLEPPEGSLLELELAFFGGGTPIPVRGVVVRQAGTGSFCVRFDEVDPSIGELLQVLLPRRQRGEGALGDAAYLDGIELQLWLEPELHSACVEAATALGLGLSEWLRHALAVSAARQREREPGPGRTPL